MCKGYAHKTNIPHQKAGLFCYILKAKLSSGYDIFRVPPIPFGKYKKQKELKMTEKTQKFQNIARKIKTKANKLKNIVGALQLNFGDSWMEELIELKHELQKYDLTKADELGELLKPMYDAQIQALDELIDLLEETPDDFTKQEERAFVGIFMPLRESIESFAKMLKRVDAIARKKELNQEKRDKGIVPLRDRIKEAKIADEIGIGRL